VVGPSTLRPVDVVALEAGRSNTAPGEMNMTECNEYNDAIFWPSNGRHPDSTGFIVNFAGTFSFKTNML
jgi:hypothetical protein